jgi:hypothetical protein
MRWYFIRLICEDNGADAERVRVYRCVIWTLYVQVRVISED